jgi:hypothetical protein
VPRNVATLGREGRSAASTPQAMGGFDLGRALRSSTISVAGPFIDQPDSSSAY